MADGEHRHAVSPHGAVDAEQRLEEVDDQSGWTVVTVSWIVRRLRRKVGASAKAFVAVRRREIPRPLATANPGLGIDRTRPTNAS